MALSKRPSTVVKQPVPLAYNQRVRHAATGKFGIVVQAANGSCRVRFDDGTVSESKAQTEFERVLGKMGVVQ